MLNKFLLLFVFFVTYSSLLAQKTCGFDQIHKELLQSNPQYAKDVDAFEARYQDFAKSYRKRGGVYKVPVVVHVMETGTALTAITDQQIKDAIRALNEKYRKIPNTNGDGNGVDITIEFALAVRDPNGNCTDGINRVDMSGVSLYMSDGVQRSTSGITDAQIKSYISWNQTKYYNIWLVSEIDNNEGGAGIQGYAYFSSSHGASYDGAVILVNSFKDINSNTTSHELGHAFNLYHTFEGDLDGGGNSICPTNASCTTDGDKVCDTPPHKRSSSDCVVGVNACDNNSSTSNFIHNYMDYSSDVCANEFTAGQKVRMLAALTTDRASFLEANGNLALVPVSAATLDFIGSTEYACTGNNVTFYDLSTCIPNTYINGDPWANITYSWTVKSGNTTLTSTSQTPTFTLATPGIYDVTMSVTTVLGTNTLTKQGVVVVGAAPKTVCTPTSTNTGNYWCTVNNVTFNKINNTTHSYLNYAYTDFSCTKTTIVEPNKQYTFSVSLRSANNPEVVEAYIDYNNNGAFEVGELIYSGSLAANSTNTFSTNVTIPNTAVTDQPLRMRVIGEANTISAAERSCSSAYFVGDVEDYTVFVSSKAASVSIAASPSNTITYGTSVTFTATPINPGNAPIYNWYVNGKQIAGQTGATYTNAALLNGDIVTCVLISNLSGATNSPATSNNITMVVTGKPISDFSASTTNTCTGTTVSFTDLSKLAPTSWSWTFQGGTPATSTSQNPTVTYASPGTYTVTLTASNSLGAGSTATQTAYIQVYANPTAICSGFSRSQTPGFGIGITSFNFNDISNTNAYNDAVYQDFSCSKKTFLNTSTAYQVSVGTGTGNNQWLRIYIDYNGDGDFNDTGETVLSPANAKSSFSGTITTPASPVKDKVLRMRVITDFLNTSPGACTTSLDYGQVEDYGVIFKSVSCSNPTTPTVSVTNPTCANTSGTVAITSSTSGLTFSTDGVNYNSYSAPFTFAAGTNFSITAKNVGGCVSTAATGTIGALPNNITPTFTAVSPICSGTSLSALPTTSNNNITGTWSPALNNTQTTTYTFTPTAGQCGVNTTLTITVNAKTTPTFTAVSSICSGASLSALPTTSTNSIPGTWSPALNNTQTTLYTFTPSNGQCANTATLTITVNAKTTPTFSAVSPICSGASLSALPTTSTNSITGTWSPALNNTQTTLYTFTPSNGQCANTATMTITVNAKTTPTFTAVSPICSGTSLSALPTTSNNSVTGTWSPALNNTQTTLYTFTPSNGQCANTATLTITVNANTTPTFTAVSPICSGASLSALPTTSNNSITGTWSPALNNTQTTLYTFTPSNGQCANTATMTITVNTKTTPTFSAVNAICSGASLNALPTTSNNSITGTWSPALNNTQTTTYTFTPSIGQCANTTTLTITVNSSPATPSFTQVAAICNGAALSALPTISNNNITGTWSPALNNTQTTLYTFTPNSGQCANTTTMTITVNAKTTPTFTAVNAVCSGASLSALPTTSNNSITGTWSPALDNTQTTTYTFTPSQGACANTSTLTITVNAKTTPTFAAVSPICTGGSLNALPTTSNNSITGTWSPALDNTKTTVYTFTPSQGLCANSATLTITVNSTPTTPTFASIPASCVGSSLPSLPTTSLNSVTGTWSPALDNTKTTTYTFTPTQGQCASNVSLTIQMDSIPNPGVLSVLGNICQGKTASIKSSVNGGSWASDDKSIVTVDANGLITFVSEGTTNITYSKTNNSCTSTASKTLTIGKCLNLNELKESRIILYPNPTSDKLNLQVESSMFVKYEILNPEGKVLHSSQITSDNTIVTVSHLATGMYFIRLIDKDNNSENIQFVKN
jgi:PKD repeat protein